MSNKTVFLIGLVLSLLTMGILANRFENGDNNAVSMYFVIFLIPVILMVVLNTLFIMYLSTLKNSRIKLFFSFLPLCIFILLCFKELTISLIDGNLAFVALTAAIAIGITNLLWIASVYKQKPTRNKEPQRI